MPPKWVLISTSALGLGGLLAWILMRQASKGWVEVGKLTGPSAGQSFGQPALLAPQSADAFKRLESAASNAGHTILLNNAGRTYEHQKRLYDAYLAKLAAWRLKQPPEGASDQEISAWQAAKPTPAARPGTSKHEKGNAIDISTVGATGQATLAWMRGNAGQFGWKETVSREPWHWEFVG